MKTIHLNKFGERKVTMKYAIVSNMPQPERTRKSELRDLILSMSKGQCVIVDNRNEAINIQGAGRRNNVRMAIAQITQGEHANKFGIWHEGPLTEQTTMTL